MKNFSEKINMIWQIAESLRNIYRPEKYGDVVLPLSVMRRVRLCIGVHKG